MKYICLGYIEDKYFEDLTEKQQQDFMDSCFAYDEELQKNGHMIGGEALQPTNTATTVRQRGGKLQITDGPFAETKEYLGGIMLLEARDLNEAIQLMSHHPSIGMGGTFEIRPAADLDAMFEQSRLRRSSSNN
ncbi:YciI family protein [Neptunicella marina]|uniref:YciI family protein n=1 Tax=Neptunicella marina TaxID=2125989 RepID=A0A8J6IRY7_9ALTE|nr:YciI family protein [Neptunicella marina]MBC3764637.1 YciI family protein [Neptunicella marina]